MKPIVFLSFLSILLISNIKTAYGSEYSLAIDPPITRVNALLPSSIETDIKVINLSDDSVELGIDFMPFRASENGFGEPEYLIDEELEESFRDLLSKIILLDGNTPVNTFVIEPHAYKLLTLFIPLQDETKVRDYYFSVIFKTVKNDSSGSSYSDISAAIASHVLLSVGEGLKSNLTIQDFSGPKFLVKGPVDFSVLINNKGNQNRSVSGVILIKNMFGKQFSLELSKQNILAYSRRYIVDTAFAKEYKSGINTPAARWEEPFLLGYYRAELQIESEGNKMKPQVIEFFAVPAQVYIPLFIIILFSIAFYLRVIRKIKSAR